MNVGLYALNRVIYSALAYYCSVVGRTPSGRSCFTGLPEADANTHHNLQRN
jgi:hypothetical protein